MLGRDIRNKADGAVLTLIQAKPVSISSLDFDRSKLGGLEMYA